MTGTSTAAAASRITKKAPRQRDGPAGKTRTGKKAAAGSNSNDSNDSNDSNSNKKKLDLVPAPESTPKYIRPIAAGLLGHGGKADDVAEETKKATELSAPKRTQDKKLRMQLERTQQKIDAAAESAARAELLQVESAGFLEAEEGSLERTFKFSQKQIKEHVDLSSRQRIFDLKLDDQLGPYRAKYTRDGKMLLLAGRRGHLASVNWKAARIGTEFHVRESTRDVVWLHNETMFAAAQKRFVYIYDKTGAEVHCLRKHIDVQRLEFLPHHFLLASVGGQGILRYQDTSTGAIVSEYRTKLGPCQTMVQNPWNAVLNLGHSNGTVTMWSPTMSEPLVKLMAHRGPIQAIAADPSGKHMVTAGMDGKMKVWDIRNTFDCVHEYYTPTTASDLAISQRGLLAVSFGGNVSIWRDALTTKQQSPYMNHTEEGSTITNIQFCPYEDVLGIGHSSGFKSLIVPGAGEPNFDSLSINPFQTAKQRQEVEVRNLLDKLQPETIALDPSFIGTVDRASNSSRKREQEDDEQDQRLKKLEDLATKHGKRNSKLRKLLRRKVKNVIDNRKNDMQRALQRVQNMRDNQHAGIDEEEAKKAETETALGKFMKAKKKQAMQQPKASKFRVPI
ncbi:BING4CT-domain-containing protein [Ramicandelaber brevisporus]|nr:BING4CT-domain-containing protein [Ramicandelaber brevisporus]